MSGSAEPIAASSEAVEGLVGAAGGKLLEYGLLSALLVLALGGIAYLYRQLGNTYEKRIDELLKLAEATSQITKALNANTLALEANNRVMEARTKAIEAVERAVSELRAAVASEITQIGLTSSNNDDRLREKIDDLKRFVEDCSRRVSAGGGRTE